MTDVDVICAFFALIPRLALSATDSPSRTEELPAIAFVALTVSASVALATRLARFTSKPPVTSITSALIVFSELFVERSTTPESDVVAIVRVAFSELIAASERLTSSFALISVEALDSIVAFEAWIASPEVKLRRDVASVDVTFTVAPSSPIFVSALTVSAPALSMTASLASMLSFAVMLEVPVVLTTRDFIFTPEPDSTVRRCASIVFVASLAERSILP